MYRKPKFVCAICSGESGGAGCFHKRGEGMGYLSSTSDLSICVAKNGVITIYREIPVSEPIYVYFIKLTRTA